ncbi:unnamed protein product [Rotaria sp. Silwood2]|nr:unnamed protein product [Rotaria sp. Silwood2]
MIIIIFIIFPSYYLHFKTNAIDRYRLSRSTKLHITRLFEHLPSQAIWNLYWMGSTQKYRLHVLFSNLNNKLSAAVIGIEKNLLLFSTHQGIFRQCNYLSANIRSHLKIPKCQAIKVANSPHDDYTHGMINPGPDSMRLHNVAAACAILIVLLLCTGTFIGIIIGILNNVVLATMTVGVIYLISSMFCTFVIVIMYTILNSERKQSYCSVVEVLTDELCSSQSIRLSYSFILGSLFVILSFITSVLWLFLQEKQRKFAQH